MTATLPPVAPERAAERVATPRADRPVGRHPVLAEVLLAVVSVVAVAGFLRLFEDASAVLPLLVAALGAHAVGAVGRRVGWGVAATAAATAAAAVVQLSVVLYPHTSAFGLPTGATLDLVRSDLSAAWDLFGRIEAPAPRSRGFLVAAGATLWVAAALADWAAFRLRAVLEAVLPAVSVFVFTTLLGRGPGGVVLAAAMAAAVLAFTAAQRAARAARDEAWAGGRVRAGAGALARRGVLVAVLVGLAAAAVGPRLPTAGDEAVLDWQGDDDPAARTTVSPLVDIRSRLVQQSDATVFTVQADRPAYWRLTSLPVFDGQLWSSSESFEDADGDLPSAPPDAATSPLRQTFSIRALDAIWAPGALTPVELVDASVELRWNGDLATLIVPREVDSTDGITYTVVSEVPALTPDDLGAALPAELPEDVAAALEVPPLPALVEERAREAVAGAGDRPYDIARALQDSFRDGSYTYDLAGVPAGHSSSAIEAFLLARTGYCEQFAGTYAAMARTLGLPARVAVGFTPGERGRDGWTVRGRNAHAWPEVWIAGAGWVPFEPTPGRGQPGTEPYTGVPPQQDETGEDAAPTTTEAAPPSSAGPGPGGTGSTVPPEATAPEVATTPPPPAPEAADRPAWLVPALAVVSLAALALAADVAAIALVRARRRRAEGRETSVSGRVRRAWSATVEALARAGVRPRPAETAREFARRAADGLGDGGSDLARLATVVTATTWAPTSARLDPALADDAEALAGTIVARVEDGLGRRERLRAALDPRLLAAGRVDEQGAPA